MKTIKVRNATMVARRTMARRYFSVIPFVIVRKTGIDPNGFVSVKKDVKHSKAKGKSPESILMNFIYTAEK